MTPDNPQAETALTRRSSRRQAAPEAEARKPEVMVTSAERRTRTSASLPATVWSARNDVKQAEETVAVEVRPVAALPLDRPDAPVAATGAVPLTRKQAREQSLRRAAAAAVAAETAKSAAGSVPDATSIDLALSAIDDAPADLPAVDLVEVAVAGDAGEAAATAELHVATADEVFTDAVLADEDVAHAVVDEFEAAAKLFSFTGETPIQVAAAAIEEELPVSEVTLTVADQPRKRRFAGSSFRRVTAASASVGAMGIVGLLAIGMTTPAEAVSGAGTRVATSNLALTSTSSPSVSKDEIQAYVAPADAQTLALDRSVYSTASTAQIAAAAGISHYSNFFSNNANAAIQWPFAVGVSISYGFGTRSGTMHDGLDFTPGAGAHVQSIADGTVRIATESGGGYGVMVIVDHIIDGELISSRYGHMQYGSLQVKTGDTVKVGQMLGLVGDTGRSFGAHLHFELLQNGTTPIDPLPWLRTHAGG